jgi:uncharacterized protein YdeI (YjbR/CyaY-like superfamily)
MPKNPQIDAYIAKQRDFARPILEYLREVVHTACPEVTESLKWGCPHYEHHGLLGGMAAFKEHCRFILWKWELIDPLASPTDDEGAFGRITSIKDLPSKKVLISYVKKAAKLNEEGVTIPRAARTKPELPVPKELTAALKRNTAAKKTWDKFSPSHRREYIEWITEAKTDATREKRLATTLEQLAEGKSRNWKYERKSKNDK